MRRTWAARSRSQGLITRRAVRPSDEAPARRSYLTHPAKGYPVGAAPEFGPSQPWASKNPRPRLGAPRLPAPMPTLRSQQKGGYAGRSFAPGSLRCDPAMARLLCPVRSTTLSGTDPRAPPAPHQLLPTARPAQPKLPQRARRRFHEPGEAASPTS